MIRVISLQYVSRVLSVPTLCLGPRPSSPQQRMDYITWLILGLRRPNYFVELHIPIRIHIGFLRIKLSSIYGAIDTADFNLPILSEQRLLTFSSIHGCHSSSSSLLSWSFFRLLLPQTLFETLPGNGKPKSVPLEHVTKFPVYDTYQAFSVIRNCAVYFPVAFFRIHTNHLERRTPLQRDSKMHLCIYRSMQLTHAHWLCSHYVMQF